MRKELQIGLLVALILGGAAVLYPLVFADAPAPRAPALPPAAAARAPVVVSLDAGLVEATFEIAEVVGVVEVRRGDAWFRVRAGDRLAPSEAIRTGDDGGAVLRTQQGDELRLRRRVELTVGALSRTVTNLTLTRGKLRAAAAPDRDSFEIRAGGAEVRAPGGGKFTVYSDARGAVTVASDEGDVQVVAKGRGVAVGRGQATYVPPAQPPRPPMPIPDEVFLSVSWPAGELHARSTVVRGRAAPGSEVRVNGKNAPVGDDGRFSAEIPLAEGDNPVKVTAEDIGGRVVEREKSLRVDSKGPPLEADPESMYAPPKK